ncbi:hypothetical protein Pan14r_52740 [Crateriforma conspicua]|uniref:Uncharacterized protein n=1 Tax=Crateriforma conspicua TaxID=2527996 RepID=A0A5C5XUL9_9PLAN|nr:hypothetical protein Mal65_00020 [Crateriforma conspicua]TWT65725.1 hypothetical protein Pan14r_52740 [Crateriforma conspicua]
MTGDDHTGPMQGCTDWTGHVRKSVNPSGHDFVPDMTEDGTRRMKTAVGIKGVPPED